jgi:hypothetical protein
MGIVGRFCDRLCAEHPELARAVLERPIGRLSEWIQWDHEAGPCGCIIGTLALAGGIAESGETRNPRAFVAGMLGQPRHEIVAVGMAVFDMSVRIAHGTLRDAPRFATGYAASDARVIAMIRTRIAVALAVGESVPVGTEELAEVAA